MRFDRVEFEDVVRTQGNVCASFNDLVETFGDPDAGANNREARWCLRFEDGTMALIYNHSKDGRVCTEAGDLWRVVGDSVRARRLVIEQIDATKNRGVSPQAATIVHLMGVNDIVWGIWTDDAAPAAYARLDGLYGGQDNRVWRMEITLNGTTELPDAPVGSITYVISS